MSNIPFAALVGCKQYPGSVLIDPRTDMLGVIDCTPTFMPKHEFGFAEFHDGGLPVADAYQVLEPILALAKVFGRERVFCTEDKHQYGSVSLASSYVHKAPLTPLSFEQVKDWDEQTPKRYLSSQAQFTVGELKAYLNIVKVQWLWPDHGIQGTGEANLHPALRFHDYSFIHQKGMDTSRDSYSAFFDNGKADTGLNRRLTGRNVTRLFFCGIAYDFCVGFSAVDAAELGYESYVIVDATRPVAVPGSIMAIEQNFERVGVQVITSDQLAVTAIPQQ